MDVNNTVPTSVRNRIENFSLYSSVTRKFFSGQVDFQLRWSVEMFGKISKHFPAYQRYLEFSLCGKYKFGKLIFIGAR